MGLPAKGTIFGCARYAPDDFGFSVKISQLITHDKRLDVLTGHGVGVQVNPMDHISGISR